GRKAVDARECPPVLDLRRSGTRRHALRDHVEARLAQIAMSIVQARRVVDRTIRAPAQLSSVNPIPKRKSGHAKATECQAAQYTDPFNDTSAQCAREHDVDGEKRKSIAPDRAKRSYAHIKPKDNVCKNCVAASCPEPARRADRD